MHIRQARPENLPAIAALEARVFPPAEAASPESFAARFAVFPHCFFVAEDDGAIVGHINGCMTDFDTCRDELYHDAGLHREEAPHQAVFGLVVDPQRQHQGIGAALVRHFLEVVPLVLATLVSGAASVGDVGRLGRVAAKTLVFYFATTALAVAIGLVLGNIFQPGVGLDLSTANLSAKEVAAPSLVQVLMGIVPLNPVDALAKGNILQIIFFAVLVGMAISLCGDKAKPAAAFFDAMSEVMIRVTSMVMHYAPIGVFALMAYTVSNHGLEVLLPLIKLIGIMYLSCLIHVIITYLPCIRYAGLKPGTFFRGLSAPLLTSFTTCSSAAALSTNLTCVQKLGASRSVSSFSIPLGNTINMDGTAIYMGIVTIFAAEIYGMPLPLDQQISVLLIALLASVGTMGVPGAALIMLSMIFTHVGIPLEAIALVAGIDRVMDMARTTINVLGDATAAIFISRTENDFDPQRGAALQDE